MKLRAYGEDSPFSRWFRWQYSLDSSKGWTLTDEDFSASSWTVHRFADLDGNKRHQVMLKLEVKTHEGLPRPTQLDDLFLDHQMIITDEPKRVWSRVGCQQVLLTHRGWRVLRFQATGPEDSEAAWLYEFNEHGSLHLVHKMNSPRRELLAVLTELLTP